jgi:hypothetical protein
VLGLARTAVDEDVANRADDAATSAGGCLEERQQLRSELHPPEREQLDDDHGGGEPLEALEQHRAPAVDDVRDVARRAPERTVDPGRELRELNDLDSRRRFDACGLRSAPCQRHVEPLAERSREGVRPHEMAEAERVLAMEQQTLAPAHGLTPSSVS